MKKNILITKIVLWGFLCISMMTSPLRGSGSRVKAFALSAVQHPKKHPYAFTTEATVGVLALTELLQRRKSKSGPLTYAYNLFKRGPVKKYMGYLGNLVKNNKWKTLGGAGIVAAVTAGIVDHKKRGADSLYSKTKNVITNVPFVHDIATNPNGVNKYRNEVAIAQQQNKALEEKLKALELVQQQNTELKQQNTLLKQQNTWLEQLVTTATEALEKANLNLKQ